MKKELVIFKKIQLFFPLVLVMVLNLILFLKVVLPEREIIRQNFGKIKEKRAKLSALKTKAEALANLDSNILGKNFQIANRALPSEKDPLVLLTALNNLLGATTLTSGKIELAPGIISATESATKKEVQNFLTFKLRVEGNLTEIKAFLAKISKTSPLLAIKSLTLNSSGGNFSADLEMVFYWQPLPSFLGKVSDPLATLTGVEEKTLKEISQYTFYSPFSEEGVATTSPSLGKANLFE